MRVEMSYTEAVVDMVPCEAVTDIRNPWSACLRVASVTTPNKQLHVPYRILLRSEAVDHTGRAPTVRGTDVACVLETEMRCRVSGLQYA